MKNRNKYHAQSQKQAYLFLAPSMLILTVFVFIPLVGALVISVMNIDIYMNNISFAGFGNYLKMFHDSRIGNATFILFCTGRSTSSGFYGIINAYVDDKK